MTTTITRLLGARNIITQILRNIKDDKFTKQSFANTTIDSLNQYGNRRAIILEFSTIANHLNFPSNNPIHTEHPDFCKAARQLYSVHINSIENKDGEYGPMTEVDYNKVWNMIIDLEKEVYPAIDVLIKAERTKEKKKKGEEGRA